MRRWESFRDITNWIATIGAFMVALLGGFAWWKGIIPIVFVFLILSPFLISIYFCFFWKPKSGIQTPLNRQNNRKRIIGFLCFGIAGFVASFFIWLVSPEFRTFLGRREEACEIICVRQYTAQNEIIPVTLSVLSPDFSNPIIKTILGVALSPQEPDLELNPIVYKNLVFEAVDEFVLETGNRELLEEYRENGYGHQFAVRKDSNETITGYNYTDRGYFEDGSVTFASPGTSFGQRSDIAESDWEFNKNRLPRLARGESVFFTYAPIHVSLRTNDVDGEYTSLIKYTPDDFLLRDKSSNSSNPAVTIFQIPKLSDLASSLQLDHQTISVLGHQPSASNWIRDVIAENPDVRGFIAFAYPSLLSLDDYAQYNYLLSYNFQGSNFDRGCADWLGYGLSRITSSPYVKFVDITNNTDSTVRISSLKFETLDRDSYKLTNVDSRKSLFEDAMPKLEDVNLLLEPKQHLIIPLEFGFYTKTIKDRLMGIPQDILQKSDLRSDSLYAPKPLSNIEYRVFSDAIEDGESRKALELFSQQINFSDEFLNSSASPEEISNSIPNRFAIGSILNLVSIEVEGERIKVASPQDEPNFVVSADLLAGSCPYLMVYNSEENDWLEMGTILYARRDKSLQGDEIHELGDIKKLKLEEREQETTFIDSLSILYIDSKTGVTREAILQNSELLKQDEHYLVLRQGEQLEIDLEEILPANVNASNVRLKINGYYEVDPVLNEMK
jgi:hypothetical protein